MADSTPLSDAPGGAWLPDPWQPDGQIRWWSGTEWTSHVHALPQLATEVDFGAAVKRGYRGWAKFSGRASLTEYWWWFLFASIVSAIAYFVGYILIFVGVFVAAGTSSVQPTDGGSFTTSTNVNGGAIALFVILGLLALVAFVLAIVVPWLAVSARRLHDSGRSGWWLLLLLVPIGSLFVTVFLAFPSTPGANQYGPVPGAH